jgi:hypothetical protein
MIPAKLRRQLEACERRVPPACRHRKATTAWNRQELDRILDHLSSLPPDAPAIKLTPAEATREREILAELDAMIAELAKAMESGQ